MASSSSFTHIIIHTHSPQSMQARQSIIQNTRWQWNVLFVTPNNSHKEQRKHPICPSWNGIFLKHTAYAVVFVIVLNGFSYLPTSFFGAWYTSNGPEIKFPFLMYNMGSSVLLYLYRMNVHSSHTNISRRRNVCNPTYSDTQRPTQRTRLVSAAKRHFHWKCYWQ